jgi:hypothetical protein
VLFYIVGGVLLIACANVASLLIARASARQKEIAVGWRSARAAGASSDSSGRERLLAARRPARPRVAAWTTRFSSASCRRVGTPHVSPAPSTTGSSRSTSRFRSSRAALRPVPALRSTRPSLAPTLKDQAARSRRPGGVRLRKSARRRAGDDVGAAARRRGLFIRSLRNLRTLDLGLKTDNLIAFNVRNDAERLHAGASKQFHKQLLDRVRALPGVDVDGFAQIGMLEGNEWDSSMSVEGYEPKPGENMNPFCNAVSPGYFKTMQIPLVAGRDFDDRDARYVDANPIRTRCRSFKVAIVNESYAKKYFGDRSPIGRHIGFGTNPGTKTPIEIVGVVKDAKYMASRRNPAHGVLRVHGGRFRGGAVMYVRTASRPGRGVRRIREVLRQLDPNVPMVSARTMEAQLDQSLLNDRLVATLSAPFGALATLLAVIGLYGVMAFTVQPPDPRDRRAHGARRGPGDVVWLVMREVLMLVGTGVVLGLAARGGWDG